MKIEILGNGGEAFQALYENAQAAVKASGVDAEVVKIDDLLIINKYCVMVTPALVIDGVIRSEGKVLSAEELKNYIL